MSLDQASQDWWNKTKATPEAVVDWLTQQYHGEVTAAERIKEFAQQFAPTPAARLILSGIMSDENQHASWIGQLLVARGVEPKRLEKTQRYWDKTLPGIESFEQGTAVGAHAEEMRLARIKVIASDPETPQDIRDIFLRILWDEEYHARAFREMTTTEAYQNASAAHREGLNALGLV